jgi:outer membrane receptor for ferrienterochelin and colicins
MRLTIVPVISITLAAGSMLRAAESPEPEIVGEAAAPVEAAPASSASPDATAEALADYLRLERLEVPVSVASKNAESASSAPSTVTVFTAEEIRRMGIRRLEDLLNYIPGFHVATDHIQGRMSDISVRGVADFLSKDVLILLDGQPLNDAFSGGAVMINRLINVDNIDHVEVVRGAGGALYGSNASTAVVSIKTKTHANGGKAFVGSTNLSNVSANVSQRIKDIGLNLSVFALADDGYTYKGVADLRGNVRSTRDPLRGFDAKAAFTWGNFSLELRRADWSQQDFLSYFTVSRQNSGAWQQTWGTAKYKASLLPDDKLQVTAGVSEIFEVVDVLAVIGERGTLLGPPPPAGPPPLASSYISGPYLEMQTTRAFVDASWQLSADNLLVAGLMYSYSKLWKAFSWSNTDPLTLQPLAGMERAYGGLEIWNAQGGHRQIASAYVQDQHAVGDFLKLTVGGRIDQYSDVGTALTPRASAVFSLPFGGHLKLIYARAFRAPNFFELYDRNNPADFGNANLRPEILDNFEVGYVQNVGNILTGSLSVYHNRIRDVVGPSTTRPLDVNNPLGAPQFANSGSAKTYGLEVEVKATPLDFLYLLATYSHFFEKALFPENMAAWAVNLTQWGANLNVNGIYRQAIPSLAYQTKDHTLVNVVLQYKVLNAVHVSAQVDNIGDTRFGTYSTYGLANGVPNRGRTFLVGLMGEI